LKFNRNTSPTPTSVKAIHNLSSLQSAQLQIMTQTETIDLISTRDQEIITNVENNTINKYIHQIDLLTPEFKSKLPTQEREILNKIFEQETPIKTNATRDQDNI
jgi:hypothetical protein